MRFLADESCDFGVVRALRAVGHDVLSVAEIAPRARDTVVIRLAHGDKRILLTEDKDFGQLVYAYGHSVCGVIFIRYPASARKQLQKDIVKLVRQRGDKIIGCFIVVQPGRVRISRFPD